MKVLTFSRIPVFLVFLSLFADAWGVWAQKVGDSYPSSAEVLEKGYRLLGEDKIAEAAALYETIAPGDSLIDRVLFNLSLCYSKLENYERALAVLDELDGYSHEFVADVAFQRASVLEKMKRYDEAEACYDSLIAKNPMWQRPHYEKAIYYSNERKDYPNAVSELRKGFDLNRMNSHIHSVLGSLASEADQPALACMAWYLSAAIRSGDRDHVARMILLIEAVANDLLKKELEVDPELFAFAGDLEGLNEIIRSKAAMSSKYKLKVKADYAYVRVMQVICEKLPDPSDIQDPMVRFYVALFKEVWEKNHFTGMVFFPFQAFEGESAAKLASRNKKAIDAFAGFANEYIDNSHKGVQFRDGKTTFKADLNVGDQCVSSVFNVDEQSRLQGVVINFYSNGQVRNRVSFRDDIPVGEYVAYHENGQVSQRKYFNEKGELHGMLENYGVNGVIKDRTEYRNGQQQGEVSEFNFNGSVGSTLFIEGNEIKGKVRHFDDNGFLLREFEVRDGKRNGEYVQYYPSGRIEYKGVMVNGLLEGDLVVYYESGAKRSEGKFSKGNKNGPWKWYHENGKTEEEVTLENNEMTGIRKEYNDKGVLVEEETYKGGVYNGLSTYYDRNGRKFSETDYRNGKAIAYRFYSEDGTMFSESKASGGKVHVVYFNEQRVKSAEGYINKEDFEGEWKFYGLNGLPVRTLNYKAGVKEGISTDYHPNGKIKGEYFYRNGELDGYYREYNIFGGISEEGYYKNGVLHGPAKQYSKEGSVIWSAFYWNDKLNGWERHYEPKGEPDVSIFQSFGVRMMARSFDREGNITCESFTPQGNGDYFLCEEKGKRSFGGKIVNNIPAEPVMHYHPNGKLFSQQPYQYGRKEGRYNSFFWNGVLSKEGDYLAGKASGLWKAYSLEGNLRREYVLKDGDYEGRYVLYYENGKVAQERHYRQDERDSISTVYAPDGTLCIRLNYNNGLLVGYSYLGKDGKLVPEIPIQREGTTKMVAYYPNGKKSQECSLLNNDYHGMFERYDSDGSLLVQSTYVDGMKDGESKEYHANGKLFIEETLTLDINHGLYRTYHDNGKIRSEETYYYDSLHGPARYYDKSGKLIAEGEYYYGDFYEKR